MSVDEVRALLGISELSEDIDISKAGKVREKDRERGADNLSLLGGSVAYNVWATSNISSLGDYGPHYG